MQLVQAPTPRPVAASVDDLLAGATLREPLVHSDGKSGAILERVVIGGDEYVVKHLDLGRDWTMRAVGDLGCKTLQLWRSGLLDLLPECIDQPIVGVAHDVTRGPGGRATTLLMRDVGKWLVPEGDEPIPLEQHLGFLDHMAAMHTTFWDFDDTYGLTPPANRYFELSPWTAATERALGSDAVVPPLIAEGWSRFPTLAPRAAEVIRPLLDDPAPLLDGLATTPATLLHANWKLGNLGTHADGRTILLDWEAPGRGWAAEELAWYLAINCRRLPHDKEAAIDAYRDALRRHGVTTDPWWERQLALALVGGLVHFGWEKSLGDDGAELGWWEERAVAGARFLA
jgi:hypothetical protein